MYMHTEEELMNLSKEDLIAMVMTLQKDTLTGVYKREVLNNIKDKDVYTVAFIDINGLKQINDIQGHAAGDKYISDIANDITDAIGMEDKVFRYGGDEFIVLFKNSTHSDIENTMSAIANVSYGIGTSNQLKEAIEIADSNMYIAKKNHYNSLV